MGDVDSDPDPDLISELPESLIIQILSLLDMKYAVRTGILSKRWKNLWTQVDSISFHYPDEDPSEEQVDDFVSFIDNVLMKCTCSNLNSFSVSWAFDCDWEYFDEADKWFEFVVRNNVKFVKWRLKGLPFYCFPNCFYENSSFVGLEMEDAYTSFYDESFRLNNLKYLSLKCVRVMDGFIRELQLGCPVLQTIVFDDVKEFYEEIDIFSPSIKDLKLLNLEFHYDYGDDERENRMYGYLKITAPWVEQLEIGGKFLGVLCELVNMSSLKNVNLTFSYSMVDLSRLPWRNHEFYSAQQNYFEEHPYALWVSMVRRILRPIYHVEQIDIGTELIQAFSLLERVERPSSTSFMCKRLTLNSLISIYELPGILYLLRSTPLLKTLVVKMTPCQSHFQSYCDSYFHVNDILYWASQKETIVCLEEVWIDYGEYFRSENDNNYKVMCFDYYLVLHILQCSPTLKKLVIRSSELNFSRYFVQYAALLCNDNLIGKKASEWKLLIRKGEFEYNFCKSKSMNSSD